MLYWRSPRGDPVYLGPLPFDVPTGPADLRLMLHVLPTRISLVRSHAYCVCYKGSHCAATNVSYLQDPAQIEALWDKPGKR